MGRPWLRNAAILAATLLWPACAHDVSWKSYQTSEYLDVRHELFGRVRIRLDKMALTDCTVCFGPRTWYTESCAHIDESGLFRKAANRPFAWLKEIECRLEHGGKVGRVFSFPYFAADVRADETTNYLGDIQIDLNPDGSTIVVVSDDLAGFNTAWSDRGRPALILKVAKSLLKMQDNVWIEERKTLR